MNELQKELIIKTIYTFAKLSNITDKQVCEELINKLTNMNINDSIDTILVSLNSLLNRGVLKKEDVFSNVDLLLSLNPEKYKNSNALIARLNWIKSMNMEYPKMPLSENHKLVLETFDEFNKLIGTNFDCFYTGGLMGYLATNHKLERYHGDLDLFINEQQLETLRDLLSQNRNFEFISNMDHKEVNGHEYKITYKGTPMSIGLFLFERMPDQGIAIKEYYYENMDINGPLLVDEHHLSKEYTQMILDNQVRQHNGIPYKMQSLESIYNSKKNSRPKDRYDAEIIKNNIDMLIDYKLDTQKQNNYDINHKDATNSVVSSMEHQIRQSTIESEPYSR